MAQKNLNNFIEKSIKFLKKESKKRGFKNAVVGLSGGLDSSVVAVLASFAFQDNIKAVALPSLESSPTSLEHAKTLANKFNIDLEVCPIDEYEKAFLKTLDSNSLDSSFKREPDIDDSLLIGNFCSRIRMALLYAKSAKDNALVLGTSNKSELMLGYGTIYGDLASALNPIGSLFKTEVFKVGLKLGIPEVIIKKPPSADLFPGQSDEKELGFSYAQIDSLLNVLCKVYGDFNVENFKHLDSAKFIKMGFDKVLVKSILKRIESNLFKQQMPRIYQYKWVFIIIFINLN